MVFFAGSRPAAISEYRRIGNKGSDPAYSRRKARESLFSDEAIIDIETKTDIPARWSAGAR